MEGIIQSSIPKREEAEDQRVLVVVMNSPRDLAIAREQGWYRIPLKRAPKQIAADLLAFYQTSVFAEDKWTIRYYAPIQSYRLVSRAQLLPEEATHPRANDLYYKIEIGPLQALPRPIASARLRRITFIPTTWQQLLAAREINDLWPAPPSAEQLWKALQAAGLEAERQYEVQEGRASYTLDLALFCVKGKIGVECAEEAEAARHILAQEWAGILEAKGWDILRLTQQQLQDAAGCVHLIHERVAAYGGPDPEWRDESGE